VRLQPVGQVLQVPQLGQMDAELEQAVLVQPESRGVVRVVGSDLRIEDLDRHVVGTDGDDIAVVDPFQQPVVMAVEPARHPEQAAEIRLLVHSEQQGVEPGIDHEEVAGADLDLLGVDRPHHLVIAETGVSMAMGGKEIDQHAAALGARLGQILDAEARR